MSKTNPVDYFFVGPPKTGTTWIYEVLTNINEINLSNHTKELEFFNKNYERGFLWYHESFHKQGALTCDISPSYYISEKARTRIKEYNPRAKIIITIRNPVKRLISHYKHNIRFGILKKVSMEQALKIQPDLVENSMYAKYIKRWIKEFGSENVLVLPLEILTKDARSYVEILAEFLGVQINFDNIRVYNKVNYSSQPRNYFLARSARIIRKKINDLGFHRIVKMAKKFGLKKVIFEGGQEIEIDENKVENLKSLFTSDLQKLENLGICQETIEDYRSDKNVR
jgi:hypothetical protein